MIQIDSTMLKYPVITMCGSGKPKAVSI